MPIDASIALGVKPMQFDSPINDLAEILQLQGLKQGNQLNQMKMDEYGRGVQRTNALHSILSGDYATPDARQTALIKGGFLKEASDYAKGNADVAKTAAEVKFKELEAANKRVDLAGSVFGYVRQNPTPENAFAALEHLATNGIYTPDQVAEYKARIQANPQSVAQMADLAFRGALSAKEQLAKTGTVNAGDRVINQSVDPVSGKVVETASTVIKESEAERLRREQSAREAAAGRAQSERHFQVTQANTKVPSGYRLAKDGVSLEAIPGGPADLKAQAVAGAKATGAADVDSAIAVLRDAYDRLESGGGITSTNKGPLDNTAAAISSSGIGQVVGRTLGTNNQSARNDIAMSRPALLAAMMKATGMSAKQMDSNAELKMWMATATDPTLDVESNRRALDNIERKYLSSQGTPKEVPTNPQDAQALEWANSNPNDPRAKAIKQRLGVK